MPTPKKTKQGMVKDQRDSKFSPRVGPNSTSLPVTCMLLRADVKQVTLAHMSSLQIKNLLPCLIACRVRGNGNNTEHLGKNTHRGH